MSTNKSLVNNKVFFSVWTFGLYYSTNSDTGKYLNRSRKSVERMS